MSAGGWPVTRPWHRRRLRVSPGRPHASEPARMRAHLLALGAWMAAGSLAAVWRSAAVMSPGEAAKCRGRLRRAVACAARPVAGQSKAPPRAAPDSKARGGVEVDMNDVTEDVPACTGAPVAAIPAPVAGGRAGSNYKSTARTPSARYRAPGAAPRPGERPEALSCPAAPRTPAGPRLLDGGPDGGARGAGLGLAR